MEQQQRKMHKSRMLPHTSRVNEKIVEYYTKFGQERDLEKFMRLYSPAGSQRSRSSKSRTTTSSCCSGNASEGDDGIRRLFRLYEELDVEERQLIGASKSLPNMDLNSCEQEEGVENVAKECLIPIRIDIPTSAADEQTPKKSGGTNTKQTQTPDSVIKSSHKRLEWDSLGDVGYKKSMSTSNISRLERSLLREFFQETSTTTTTTAAEKRIINNASEGDLKQLQEELLQAPQLRTAKSTPHEQKYNTPPLASSTLMEPARSLRMRKHTSKTEKATRSHIAKQMSLQQKFEKSAQTSMLRSHHPVMATQAVQVNMSTNATPSLIGSSATPSSFEYCENSSHSSHSTANSNVVSDYKSRRRELPPQTQPHPFVAGITELISNRRALADRNQQHQQQQEGKQQNEDAALQQLHDTLRKAFEENKENNSSSLVRRSPQLDLGIKLLCSLIDARSLDAKQKKQLIRDIVKRITRLSDTNIGDLESLNHTPSNSGLISEHSTTSSRATVPNSAQKYIKSSPNMQEISHNLPADKVSTTINRILDTLERGSLSSSVDGSEQLQSVQVLRKPSPQKANVAANIKRESSKKGESKVIATNSNINVSNNVPQVTPQLTKRNVEPEEIDVELQIKISHDYATTTTATTTNRKPTSIDTHSNSSSSTTSRVITVKAPNALNNSPSTDAEQASMREWLNPLTQSEIEYEENKRKLAHNTAKREKMHKAAQANKINTERSIQLDWIETEIQRLESLRHLLLKEDVKNNTNTTTTTNESLEPKKKNNVAVEQLQATISTDKLYDTVADQSSSLLSESAERMVQEIEMIIEVSNEDIITFNDNIKRSKERKRETQIIYEKSKTDSDLAAAVNRRNKAQSRTVKETIVTNEQPVLPTTSTTSADKLSNPIEVETTAESVIQRSKIATPTASNDSESVGSFVQQRKREFMEHYKNKKKSHYNALLQQQQQQEQQQKEQMKTTAGHTVNVAAQTSNGHYSVPHTVRRIYPTHEHHYHYYNNNHNNNIPPHLQQRTLPPTPPPRPHGVAVNDLTSSSHTDRQNQPNSSSSLFCISSEISIPMGSNDSSSTPTTTHQYDDVGVQTGNSMLRSGVIFGAQTRRRTHLLHAFPSGQSASVQVKPKAIAYVINFDSKASIPATSSTTTNFTTTTTTNTDQDQQQEEKHTEPVLTLQEHLERAKPKFLAQSKKRKAILNQLQAMRQERDRKMREMIDNTSISSLDTRLQRLPPPPTMHIRIFPTKEMKAMTNKRCAILPEVVAKQLREREEQRRRSNRILRDVFNRRLQKRVHIGKLSLNHSKTVI